VDRGPPWIEGRNHSPRPELVAGDVHGPDHGSFVDQQARHFLARADLGASGLRRRGDRPTESAGAAPRLHLGPDEVLETRRSMMQQAEGAARRARPQPRRSHRRSGDRRFRRLPFQPLVEHVAHAHRQQTQRCGEVFLAQASQAAAEAQQTHRIAQPLGTRRRQAPLQGGSESTADPPAKAVELDQRSRVSGTEAASRRIAVGAIQLQPFPRSESYEDSPRGLQELEAVRRKVEIVDDRRMKQLEAGENRRAPAPVGELVGRHRAAHLLGGLQHQHLTPGARQVGGRYETVVAAAHDDDIVTRRHRRSVKMRWAASWPGAPITPPPG
jgi:hypothetical protein